MLSIDLPCLLHFPPRPYWGCLYPVARARLGHTTGLNSLHYPQRREPIGIRIDTGGSLREADKHERLIFVLQGSIEQSVYAILMMRMQRPESLPSQGATSGRSHCPLRRTFTFAVRADEAFVSLTVLHTYHGIHQMSVPCCRSGERLSLSGHGAPKLFRPPRPYCRYRCLHPSATAEAASVPLCHECVYVGAILDRRTPVAERVPAIA